MNKICNKNCLKCNQLNVKTDYKGYPWAYECMKYGDNEFDSTKEFEKGETSE